VQVAGSKNHSQKEKKDGLSGGRRGDSQKKGEIKQHRSVATGGGGKPCGRFSPPKAKRKLTARLYPRSAVCRKSIEKHRGKPSVNKSQFNLGPRNVCGNIGQWGNSQRGGAVALEIKVPRKKEVGRKRSDP